MFGNGGKFNIRNKFPFNVETFLKLTIALFGGGRQEMLRTRVEEKVRFCCWKKDIWFALKKKLPEAKFGR